MTSAQPEAATRLAAHPGGGPLLARASAGRYAALTHDVVDDLADRLRTVASPSSGADRAELQALVDGVDLDTAGVGERDALREARELYAQHAVWFHHPAYAAHLNCPVAVPAVAAEAMLAAINTSVDTYDQSTVATLMERRLVAWACERVGYAAGDGVFTSGGTQSNLQALFLAREHALAAEAADRSRRGEVLGRLRVLTTAASHFSVARSAMLLGLPDGAVLAVGTDDGGRLDPDALAAALVDVARAGDVVMAVVATAGTTDRGVIDPLEPVADLCDAVGAWLHVDAAYGGGLLVSTTRRGLLAGIERARSVTVDFHKTFFQPVSSSALLVREPADLAAVAWHADYLNPHAEAHGDDAEPNQVDRSLQTTRRFDALKLWVTLRALGPDAVGRMVDAVCDLATRVRARLEGDPELRPVGVTDLSTVLFRYQPAGVDDATADRLVPLVRRVLLESGRAMVARTVVDGVPCLKLTLLNPDATDDDVDGVLDLVRAAAHGLLAGDDLAAHCSPPCRDAHPRLRRAVSAGEAAR
ncbi:Pyridoxal-dependent decarboxylase [Xylanimonas cellulosilytica DSM 15894]|uniref:Pyridoxal-dependent decarboxylase n=1 Tax=Xylanimonas cellulosilytica (strain DSM 15894 / JCM 12276 / CECT 5975 / KCTC 9989 / LMG 20990 / NBRC 107835 / XIL07) TaxID=446471 RepID=D1BSY1_XYLCX|nr:pyridoxal-dependent decarboxylase [Xylanimonas cellulosilytica]ACZ30823.1 Pyridoxal-dependent decarboxylase [Xylanimonas cellulosilytica DSM 15894]